MHGASMAILIYMAAFSGLAPRTARQPDVPRAGEMMVASLGGVPCMDCSLQTNSLGELRQIEKPRFPGASGSSGPEEPCLPDSGPCDAAEIKTLQLPPLSAERAADPLGTGIAPVTDPAKPDVFSPASYKSIQPVADTHGIHWGPVLAESLFFLGIEHAYRLLDPTQPYTRTALKGPFFRDWFVTVKDLKGWTDSDPFIINYIGHPVQGAVSGRILVQNDPRSQYVKPSFESDYRRTCLKAFGWAFLYELQFELGPISEASLGNSRGTPEYPHPTSYVDIVITPTVGMGWMVGEDFADRYLIKPLEGKLGIRKLNLVIRAFSNPSRTMANILRIKWPWYRDDRF